LLDELALQDRTALGDARDGTLSLAGLSALSSARQRNVLRHWMKQQAGQAPATAVLTRVIEDVLGSRADARPCVRWGKHEVRRYRDKLFVLPVIQPPTASPLAGWSLSAPLVLPGAGVLSASRATGEGLRGVTVAQGVQVRWRQGGEACRPVGRGHRHPLKKLFQEQGIPPWERDRLPLLFVGDQLVAVAGLWVCEPFQAAPDEPGYRIHWQPGQP